MSHLAPKSCEGFASKGTQLRQPGGQRVALNSLTFIVAVGLPAFDEAEFVQALDLRAPTREHTPDEDGTGSSRLLR